MIKAIFFSSFDVTEGPKVHHQIPPNSIHASSASSVKSLVNFKALSSYIIPLPSLSNRSIQVVSPTKPRHRILSYPVTINGDHYPRNAFTFNCCLVLEESTPFHSHLPVVSKLASVFRGLEEQEQFLTNELKQHGPNEGRIYAICELLLEDLNNYSECMIPIDGTTSTLNIKLFPIYAATPPLYAWQVPFFSVRMADLVDDSWDLTMLRVSKHINGVHSVKRIAELADADLKLVKKAIRHLLYYGCLILLDVFSFSAIYAPTQAIFQFVQDSALQKECLDYVVEDDESSNGVGKTTFSIHSKRIDDTEMSLRPSTRLTDDLRARTRRGSQRPHQSDATEELEESVTRPTASRLCELLLSLRQGQSVKTWVMENFTGEEARIIDIRRLITFAVIKGLIYRVHKYAIVTSTATGRLIQGGQATSRYTRRLRSDQSSVPNVRSSLTAGIQRQANQAIEQTPPAITMARETMFEEESLPSVGPAMELSSVESRVPVDQGTPDLEADDEYDDEVAADEKVNARLTDFLDGRHCFDEICTMMEFSERELIRRLRTWSDGNVQIICR